MNTSERFVIAIDPGLGGTGVALFWQVDERPPELLRTVCINAQRGPGYLYKAQSICAQFRRLLEIRHREFALLVDRGSSVVTIIEEPVLWSGSAKSHASSASGNLHKLSVLIGFLAGELFNLNFPAIMTIQAKSWKGQLSKAATTLRVQKRFTEGACTRASSVSSPTENEHIVDAIGIGLHHFGILHKKG